MVEKTPHRLSCQNVLQCVRFWWSRSYNAWVACAEITETDQQTKRNSITKMDTPGFAIAKLTPPPPRRQNGHSERFGSRPGHALDGKRQYPCVFKRQNRPSSIATPFRHCKVSTVVPAARRANSKCINYNKFA